MYKTHILGTRTVRISGAENIRVVLTGENTIVDSHWFKSVRIMFGTGSLAMSDGNIHKFRKRLVLKAFSHTALESYIPTIYERVKNSLQRWRSEKEVLAFREIKIMAFDLACRILFGTKYEGDKLKEILAIFDAYSHNLFSLPYDLPGLGFRKVSYYIRIVAHLCRFDIFVFSIRKILSLSFRPEITKQ